MKSVCYVDVTQLVHWEGKLTGIPRVMYELAVRFRDYDNVRYVSWVKQLQCYCEVDYSSSVLNRGHGITYLKNGEELSPQKMDAETLEPHDQSVMVVNKKPIAYRIAKKAVNGTRLLHPALPDKVWGKAAAYKAKSYKKITLQSGDSVFIPWGEWWDDNFLAMLEAANDRGAKLSTIIHDVGPMVTPQFSGHSTESLSNYCRRIVPICQEVFVNSICTRDSLELWLKEQSVHVPSITIFTIGDDFKHKTPSQPYNDDFVRSGLKGDDYVLTVGTVELKKNHIFYYYVYRLAYEKGIELPKMVIAGRRGWGTDTNIAIMMNDPLVKDKFVFQFDTSDEELAWLYSNTRFSVFASFYEGWGMPLAESLFYGVPVVSARSTSLIEIGDGIIDRFTQASTDECLDAMVRMMDEAYYKKKLIDVKRYKPATWNSSYATIAAQMKKKGML